MLTLCGNPGTRVRRIPIVIRRCDVEGLPVVLRESYFETTRVGEVIASVTEDICLGTTPLACHPDDLVLCKPNGTVLSSGQTLEASFTHEERYTLLHVAPAVQGGRSLPPASSSGGLTDATSSPLETSRNPDDDFDDNQVTPLQGIGDAECPTAIECVLYLTLAPSHTLSRVFVAATHMLRAMWCLEREVCLNFTELRAIHYASFFESGSNKPYPTHINNAAHADYFVALARAVVSCFRRSELSRVIWKDFRDCDVVFYDMSGKESMGDFIANSLIGSITYYIQRTYDQHSHSGFLLLPVGSSKTAKARPPAVFHGMSTKVRPIHHSLCAVYLVPRRIDFHKIYSGYDLLDEPTHRRVEHLFARVLHEASTLQYENCAPGFWDGMWKLLGWRKTDLKEARAIMPSPVSSTASMEDAVEEGTSPPSPLPPSATMVPPQPQNAFCSGFTASMITYCCTRVQEILVAEVPHLDACLCLKPHVRSDVVNFSPRDLHRWDVWAPDVAPMELERYLHPEVIASRRFMNF
eukprot:PhM_4_TR2035/c0_g2_i1/m.39487